MAKNAKTLVDIDKPHYGYFQAIYKAFYSPRLYIDVAKRWKGFGVLYLILIMAIFCIPLYIKLIGAFNEYYRNITYSLEKMPKLVIQNGEVQMDGPMPQFIKNERGEVIIIVDTTDKINTIDIKKWPELTTLVNKKQISYRNPPVRIDFLNYSSQSDEITTQKIIPNSNEVIVVQDINQFHSLKLLCRF